MHTNATRRVGGEGRARGGRADGEPLVCTVTGSGRVWSSLQCEQLPGPSVPPPARWGLRITCFFASGPSCSGPPPSLIWVYEPLPASFCVPPTQIGSIWIRNNLSKMQV